MISYWFKKLADALDKEAGERLFVAADYDLRKIFSALAVVLRRVAEDV